MIAAANPCVAVAALRIIPVLLPRHNMLPFTLQTFNNSLRNIHLRPVSMTGVRFERLCSLLVLKPHVQRSQSSGISDLVPNGSQVCMTALLV